MTLHPIHPDILPTTGIPEKMNNPLSYEPHPLCIAAGQELQAYLEKRGDWREEIDRGKMFGVLIVEKAADMAASDMAGGEPSERCSRMGYLAAYSGQIGGRSDWEGFVPAVFDYLQPDGYFKTHEAEISRINLSIARLQGDERMKQAKEIIARLQEERQKAIADYQARMREAKARRDLRRLEAQQNPERRGLSVEEEREMTRESQHMKAELRRLKKSLSEKTTLETEYADYLENILRLKQLRKTLSDALQQWLFSQFRMINYQGDTKDLLEIFREAAINDNPKAIDDHPEAALITSKVSALKMVPPAGSGECCEPKLLQYAYSHGYKPLQMAMFWWGESPREEIRHHLQYYPACNGKCKPILRWMLPEDVFCPSSSESHIYNKVETLYEDRELAVVCKPEGLLSVPGKEPGVPSVYSLMRRKYPEATGPLIVHRLDMATSGLMIVAKTDFAYHRLQAQFAHHRVRKKYIAIVGFKTREDCDRLPATRLISLPLMPDYLDRPRQTVNKELGKEAVTEYEVLERIDDRHLRLALYPQTGRTHQLRVHCAHREGLDAPILGDPLYGNEKACRLHLHAEEITFEHPLTGKPLTITRKADF